MPYVLDNPFTRIDTISVQGEFTKKDNEILFLIILQGELSMELNGQPFTAGNEDVLLAMPSDQFHISGSGTNMVQVIKMKSSFFAQGQNEHLGFYVCNSVLDRERDYTPLRRMLAQIALNSRYHSSVRLIKTMEMAYSLLYYLNTYHYVLDMNTGETSRYQTRTSVILSYIEMNYMDDISLEMLARTVYLTPAYLSRFFKKQLGVNFYEYLKKVRLRHAVEELRETDHKIIDIAIANGFSGATVFNRAFQETYHLSPKQYRLQAASEEPQDIKQFELSPEAQTVADRRLQLLSSTGIDEEDILYPTTAKYSISNIQKSRKITPIWKQAVNIGFIDTQNSALLQSQLRDIQRDIGFQYGRLEGVLTGHLMPKLSDGNYNFTYFDRHIEMLLSVNLTPYLDLSESALYFFTPQIIYTHDGQTRGYNFASRREYGEKVRALIKHCINIYGISQVENWIFEIGYLHDEYLSPSESPDEFALRFSVSFHDIKKLLPAAQVGGIVYNTAMGNDFFIQLLDALERQNTSPDFISISIFPREILPTAARLPGGDHTRFSSNPGYAIEQLRAAKGILASRPFFNQRIFVASIGTDIQMRNQTNDTCYQGTFLAKVITDFLDSVDLMAYWQLSDLNIESPDVRYPLFGGSGLLSIDGIPKPGYFVLKNFSQFREQLIEKGKNYFICGNTINTYSIVLFNYVHPQRPVYLEASGPASPDTVYSAFKDSPTEDITIYLDNLIPGKYKIIATTINRKNGSILDSLIHYGISANIQAEDIEHLKEMVHPVTMSNFEDIQNGHMEFHVQLLPHEVRFYKITRQL